MPAGMPDKTKLYQFKIDRTLGKGGTGVVYRGIDTNTGQVVAVKLFHANFFRNRMHLRDYEKSVKHFKNFKHPNVVQIYDFINGEEGVCLTQEYIDGPDLKWYIESRPWNVRERIVVVSQICNGLQYIHEQGYTHHDIKPANVLFTRKGVAKVTDYSLVKGKSLALFFDSGATQQITPMYVAPELIAKKKATPKSDIYSLGVTCYLLFTGRVPFPVDNLQRLYECHLRAIPEHPSVVNTKCPRDVGDVIMKMLRKNPDDRYENCDQLRIALAETGRSRI